MSKRRSSSGSLSFNEATQTVNSALDAINTADKLADALGLDAKSRNDFKKGALITLGLVGGVWLLNKMFS